MGKINDFDQIGRIYRIKQMETSYDLLIAMLHEFEKDSNVIGDEVFMAVAKDLYYKLDIYLTSKAWKDDFGADEAGLLPEDLKRGVLSEDGLYNLLSDVREAFIDL